MTTKSTSTALKSSSGCADRKEFAIQTLAQNYQFKKAAIVSNCCPQCYKGELAFHDIYNPRSLILREEQATGAWSELINDGKVDPTQVLNALTPETKDNHAHILTNMRVVNLQNLGPNCGGVNCEPMCILCFSPLSGLIIHTETLPNIPIHAKCCAPCSSPGCSIMVPRIPVYHTQDEVLQRCAVHAEKASQARGQQWGRTPRQLQSRPAPKPLTPYVIKSASFKPPRPTRLQAMNKRNPVKGLASLHKLLANNPLELTPPALTLESGPSEPFVKRTSLRISHDYTPRPRCRHDVREPSEISMEGLVISDAATPAASLLLKHLP
jgi:hypothetical protein